MKRLDLIKFLESSNLDEVRIMDLQECIADDSGDG